MAAHLQLRPCQGSAMVATVHCTVYVLYTVHIVHHTEVLAVSPGPMQTAQTLIRHSGLGHVDNWQYTMGTTSAASRRNQQKYVQKYA